LGSEIERRFLSERRFGGRRLDHHRGSAYTLGPSEHDQHAEPFVARELVHGAGRNEDGIALRQREFIAFNRQDAAAFEHDVDLIVLVRLLVVGLRCYENINADFDAWRLVDDLIPAVAGGEAHSSRAHVERVRAAHERSTGRRPRCSEVLPRCVSWLATDLSRPHEVGLSVRPGG
jgi:hypothetical protein